ncbi:hypothetical protein AVL50_09895 [Flammeovirga sp. SJP92]|nr:hypothetical protein AVL50_09895 [Flammeovirga sp. SJP92]
MSLFFSLEAIELLFNAPFIYIAIIISIGVLLALFIWSRQYKYVEEIELEPDKITIVQRHYFKMKVFSCPIHKADFKSNSSFLYLNLYVPKTLKLEKFKIPFSEWNDLKKLEQLLYQYKNNNTITVT